MADVKDLGKSITLKIRFGKEKTESFVLNLRENEKLLKFQESLQQKLCERFHHECLVDAELKVARTDFELHIYGKPPIRLTDNLHVRLSECGITDNCVVNVTEI